MAQKKPLNKSDLKKLIIENPEIVNQIKSEKLSEFRKKINPFNTSICEKSGYLAFSYICPQEEYLTKRTITSFVAFLNAALDEWRVPKDVPPVSIYDYVQNPSILSEMTAGWKKTDAVLEKLRQAEELLQKKLFIKEFLEEMFQYDPHEHVRSAYSPPEPEENRQMIPTPAGVLAVTQQMSKDRVKLLEDKRLQALLNMAKSAQKNRSYTLSRFNFLTNERISEEQFRRFIGTDEKDINVPQTVYTMIPPIDIFARFRNYCSVNFEKLNEATCLLYNEIYDFEFSILPAFYSEREKDVRNFIEKYKEELTLPIHIAQTGKWTILAAVKQNREVTDYISKDSLLLRRMMEQRVNDAKLGKEMMQKQAKKDKKKNELENGVSNVSSKHMEVWKEYRKSQEKDDGLDLSGCDLSQLEPDECPDDCQELPIFRVAKGGLEMQKNKINIKADI